MWNVTHKPVTSTLKIVKYTVVPKHPATADTRDRSGRTSGSGSWSGWAGGTSLNSCLGKPTDVGDGWVRFQYLPSVSELADRSKKGKPPLSTGWHGTSFYCLEGIPPERIAQAVHGRGRHAGPHLGKVFTWRIKTAGTRPVDTGRTTTCVPMAFGFCPFWRFSTMPRRASAFRATKTRYWHRRMAAASRRCGCTVCPRPRWRQISGCYPVWDGNMEAKMPLDDVCRYMEANPQSLPQWEQGDRWYTSAEAADAAQFLASYRPDAGLWGNVEVDEGADAPPSAVRMNLG
jgi:hypothetical protein